MHQQVGARELDRVAHELVDVQRRQRRRAAPEQRAEMADHLGRTLIVGHDVGADVAQFGQVERLALQHLLR
ncbi:MAG: hypothetical protein ACK559_25805, partial [bacterium]